MQMTTRPGTGRLVAGQRCAARGLVGALAGCVVGLLCVRHLLLLDEQYEPGRSDDPSHPNRR